MGGWRLSSCAWVSCQFSFFVQIREGVVFINCKTEVELLVGSSVRVVSVGHATCLHSAV